jgi:hypothetical protein
MQGFPASRTAVAGFALALLALTACGSTVDRLGFDPVDAGAEAGPDDGGEGGSDGGVLPEPMLRPLAGPSEYPNLFRDLLGKTEQEISDKIDAAYRHLFEGDAGSAAIYYELDESNATDSAPLPKSKSVLLLRVTLADRVSCGT